MNTLTPPSTPAPPVAKSRKKWLYIGGGVLALAAVGAALTNSDKDDPAADAATATVVSTEAPAVEDEPVVTDAPVQASEVPTPTTEEPVPTTEAPAAADVPALMPDVMCMNLQDAQDLIQESGVFFSGSEDATGAGRHQVLDSNWFVVDQTPAPGSEIGEFDAELSVLKYDDPEAGLSVCA